jgi:hypothetical protein
MGFVEGNMAIVLLYDTLANSVANVSAMNFVMFNDITKFYHGWYSCCNFCTNSTDNPVTRAIASIVIPSPSLRAAFYLPGYADRSRIACTT